MGASERLLACSPAEHIGLHLSQCCTVCCCEKRTVLLKRNMSYFHTNEEWKQRYEKLMWGAGVYVNVVLFVVLL